ncbi:FHA domain-containing protein [Synechococcus elongatus]|uniref:FHA domain-containing protein n=2 Tax=Synechococcus elongatus TaxID=32046 RepID=A0AAN1UT96_SYNEL|nr:FHA domain-containing protein [Synechococcus elongatus]AZB71341.1 hypothetical protein DOP62_00115 [Synechococcus elongatus PCC 11801]QFZ90992.1 FHA domain-containing protein [Synechococcus elongatus PCC 11802]
MSIISLDTRVKVGNTDYALSELFELVDQQTSGYSTALETLKKAVVAGELATTQQALQTCAAALRSLASLQNTLEKVLTLDLADPAQPEHVFIVEDSRGATELKLYKSHYTIGKADSCDIRLHSIYASRQHATLVRFLTENGEVRYRLIDGDPETGRRSANGTYVNNRSVTECDLKHYDQILFGADVKATYFYLSPQFRSLSGLQDPTVSLSPEDTTEFEA